MKDSLRRLLLFVAIVSLGSVLILVDIPFLYMLLLIIIVGFILLLVLGTITVGEIKSAFSALNPAKFLARTGKKAVSAPAAQKKPVPVKETPEKKPGKTVAKNPVEAAGGIRSHLSLLASSVGSLGRIVFQNRKPKKNVEDIDKLLDRTITEKVPRSSALESAASVPAAAGPRGAGKGGSMAEGGAQETDPFLSLSSEELETGLLDGLEDIDLPAVATPDSGALLSQEADTGLSMPDLDMPPLPDGAADEADAILAAHAGDDAGEELPGLDGGEAISDNLGDLDSINLDEIDLGDDSVTMEPAPEPAPIKAAGPGPASGSLVPATPITPAGADNQEDQGDISSFAAGTAPGSDEDMLSSLSTDIKRVKKEKDVSLLRELKDFKAPATDIEKELSDVAEQLNTAASKGAKKRDLSAQRMK